MEITVLFFGVLAEVTGINRKHYRNIDSYDDLKYRIADEFPGLTDYNYMISVNNEIIKNEPLLREGDEVAFLPPFAGG